MSSYGRSKPKTSLMQKHYQSHAGLDNYQGRGKQKRKLEAALPEGWTKIETERKTGASAGKKDTQWKSPDGKKICRSPMEIDAYVKSLPK